MTDQFDSLGPRDVVIALRSLRRRFGRVVNASAVPEMVAVCEEAGPDGLTLAEIVAATATEVSFIGDELERSLDHSDPLIPAAVSDPEQRQPSPYDSASADLRTAVDQIGQAGEDLGDRVEAASSQSITRKIRVADQDDPTTPLAIGREMARTAVRGLRAAEAQIERLQPD